MASFRSSCPQHLFHTANCRRCSLALLARQHYCFEHGYDYWGPQESALYGWAVLQRSLASLSGT